MFNLDLQLFLHGRGHLLTGSSVSHHSRVGEALLAEFCLSTNGQPLSAGWWLPSVANVVEDVVIHLGMQLSDAMAL